MPWLLRDGDVLAAIEIATSRRDRRRGLLRRDGIDGALLLDPARSVHTVRMRFPIDVAFCARTDEGIEVIDTVCMAPGRIGLPRWGARCVIEAASGAFERWGMGVGDHLEIR
ncbi:MAG: hypothetical protein NVS3B12_01110 [Acidimicrobiales bacterium]